MLVILFLVSIFSNGFFLLKFFPSSLDRLLKWCIVFSFGSLFSITAIYVLSGYIFHQLTTPLLIYSGLSCFLLFANRKFILAVKIKQIVFNRQSLLFAFFFLFSWYIFAKTFTYNNTLGQFHIASNVYADFGAHIPFIRSFSLGSNFPPEVPFFGGAGLLYYFSFDFYAGILEFLHMRIDIAYNLLSSISFACLLSTIYLLGKILFKKSRAVGAVSVVFFLFSSNLSFITYFYHFGLNVRSILAIWHNSLFYEGLPFPYSHIPLAGFWNLNPFTNQHPLIFGVLIVLLFVYIFILLLKRKQKLTPPLTILLGISFGFLSLWHVAMFLSLFLLLCGFFIFEGSAQKRIVVIILVGLGVAFPEFVAISFHSQNKILFSPGFLISGNLTLLNFLIFWGINLGFSLLTGLVGFLLSKKDDKKIFLVFMLIFLLPNIFHVSSKHVFDDHKFFNLWIILFNFYSAFFVATIWNKKVLGKIIAITCIFFLTLSGVISFFTIKNDVMTTIADYKKNTFLTWSLTHLPSNQVIFTNGDIYDPLSLIGKKIFLGRVYYIFSYGGDYAKRVTEQTILFDAKNERDVASVLSKEHIRYVVFYTKTFAPNTHQVDISFYANHFKKIYEDTNASVFDTNIPISGSQDHNVFQQ